MMRGALLRGALGLLLTACGPQALFFPRAPDAGVPDAGVPDAGVPDAGVPEPPLRWVNPRPQGNDLLHVFGVQPQEPWLVGDGGTILRGPDLTPVPSGTLRPLRAAWGAAAADLWFAGDAGTLLRFDGQAVSAVDSGTREDLLDLWGTGPSDVWVVGRKGTVLRFDGQSWARVRTDDDMGDVLSVWAAGPGDVWFVAQDGARSIYRFDGAQIAKVEDPRAMASRGVYNRVRGSGPEDVWFAGSWITRFDGTRFTTEDACLLQGATGLSVRGVGEVWLSGPDGVCQRDQAGWQQKVSAGLSRDRATSIWAPRGGAPWIAGPAGSTGQIEGAAIRWRSQSALGLDDGLLRAWPLDGDELFLSGQVTDPAWERRGGVFRWDGAALTALPAPPVQPSVYGLWASGPQDLWALGQQDGARWNGARWEPILDLPPHSAVIWGQSAQDLWVAAADPGQLLHFDGVRWETRPVPLTGVALALAGRAADDVWAAGPAGGVAHFDGRIWTAADLPKAHDVYAIYAGPEAVWVGGYNVVARRDGDGWIVEEGAPLNELMVLGLWGSGRGEVWAAAVSTAQGGGRATPLRWNGRVWEAPAPAVRGDFVGVVATATWVWLHGPGGRLVRAPRQAP